MMSHHFHTAAKASTISNRAIVRCARGLRLSGRLLLAASLLAAPLMASGQLPLSPSPQLSPQVSAGSGNAVPNSMSPGGEAAASDHTGSSQANDPTAQLSLSSEQIITLLQQSPDLALELKSQVADQLQEQGRQIDANDLSDEMLYEQIVSSATLRMNITAFLRARGYVSDDDLEIAALSGEAGSGLSGQRALLQAQSAPLSSLPPETAESAPMAEGSLPQTSAGPLKSASRPRGSAKGQEEAKGSTDVPEVLRLTAPYNLRSMRDLYTQVPDQAAHLKRFGSDTFVNRDLSAARGVSARDTPLDVPIGPDYVVGPGDTLTINMWGGVATAISRMIDRDGRVLLPEAGSVQLAGLSLDQVQNLVQSALRQQYRNAQVTVTVARLRSVRVYVVGDVQRPGGYDISSLATPLSGLYAAGGPTSVGSLRTLRHYRGQRLVEDVDLYDFLLHGVRTGSAKFENGDTLLVPAAGPEVAVYGAVKRPAIYEVKPGETSLARFLEDAGGLTAAASLGHITIERIDANQRRETVTLKIADGQSSPADREAIAAFHVQDGDRIRVEPILSYSERAIYLEGHVARPGRLPFSDGMRLSDVLRSYRDMLPEPAAHAEIVRLVPPDLHAETIDFDVPEVLIGNANVDLQPFDTIRIFGRYQLDAPKATILGEVLRPGNYPLSSGMTAAQLVRMAGGFKRDALLDKADLTSYTVASGDRIVASLATVPIGAAVNGKDPQADLSLKPGDVLTVHQITGWNDIGQSITIEGQVRFPGVYGFHDGEHLSSILRRAGGFLDAAYPMGAVLVRDQVRELEQKSREELIRQIEANSAAARLSPNLGPNGSESTLQLIKAQQDQVLADLKNHPPSGRMVIHITADIDSWANTPADIELRRGDVLTIPKRPGFVLVTGQVYNATALTFAPGRSAGWYLSHAGGTNSTANRKEVFIIRANGSVVGRHSGGLFDPNVLSTQLNPGDVVVVPQKIIGASLFWRNLLTTAQLASSIAITAAVASI
jgi:protein involved in polysaccharide export with SLBB domain